MGFDFFLILCAVTGCVAISALLYAYRTSRDSFHPMIYMGLMCFFLYCYMPFALVLTGADKLQTYLSIGQFEYVQFLNLLGVVSLSLGVLCGGGRLRLLPMSKQGWLLPPIVCRRLKRAAIVCGLMGVVGFAYGIASVGGLGIAYGRAYGGGWSESGYVRESVLLTIPALLWLMTSHLQTRLSKLDWLWILLFAMPLLIHGLLGARRGPTAMVISVLVVGWYLIRGRRPNLSKTVMGSVVLGVLMLFLVSNRANIYLGSNVKFEQAPTNFITVFSGNEFVYGSGVILNADTKDEYLWGRRYFTIFFIRPIPRFLWPTKYEDASEMLKIPNLEQNLGTGEEALTETLGWRGAKGAAPGIVADMWLEFWWYSFLVLFFIGLTYGITWRKAIVRGGVWIPTYTIMTALSVYLVMQTLEAMAFRFLLMAAAAWLIWSYGTSHSKQPKQFYFYSSYLPKQTSHH